MEKNAKINPFFYKERKRTQRSERSFEKNGCPTLLPGVTKIENIETHWSVAQAGLNDEKNWLLKISLDCPLKLHYEIGSPKGKSLRVFSAVVLYFCLLCNYNISLHKPDTYRCICPNRHRLGFYDIQIFLGTVISENFYIHLQWVPKQRTDYLILLSLRHFGS